jgi:hypothetical protein
MMNLTIKWDNPDDDDPNLAVKLTWGSHTARLEARSFAMLAEMVGRQILGCLDEEIDALVEDILAASDDSILVETKQNGDGPEAVAVSVRTLFEKTVAAMHRADRKFEN